MTSELERQHQPPDFAHVAERFARRVADDARFFADRIEEHVGDLARTVSREWRERRLAGPASRDDVRRLFDDVRGVVRDVVDGVDQLLEAVFCDDGEVGWSRVVLERDAMCGGWLAAGREAWVSLEEVGERVQCQECRGL